MAKYKKVFFVFYLTLVATAGNAQKKIASTYYGGHGCIDLTLKLYTDSTYIFEQRSALFIPTKSVARGAYIMEDSTITLYRKKKLHFVYFKLENKYHENTYRIRNDEILLYTKEQELTSDSGFIKAYNTLWRSKN